MDAAARVLDGLAGTGFPAERCPTDSPALPIGDGRHVLVTEYVWIGVGHGPRIWPLAFLLFAAGPQGAGRTLERYRRSISLSGEELARLPGVMIARPLTLDLWSVAYGRMTAQQAITRARAHRARVDAIGRALGDSDRPL